MTFSLTTAQLRRGAVSVALAAALALPGTAVAARDAEDQPSAGAMVGDILVARPVGLLMTVGGLAAFTVSLPVSLLSGNAGEAGETLVIGPVRETFLRCLGCKRVGENREADTAGN